MESKKKLIKSSCWCYAMKKQVNVTGFIAGQRQTALLKVTDCEHKKTCTKAYEIECLINKIREGRWP